MSPGMWLYISDRSESARAADFKIPNPQMVVDRESRDVKPKRRFRKSCFRDDRLFSQTVNASLRCDITSKA